MNGFHFACDPFTSRRVFPHTLVFHGKFTNGYTRIFCFCLKIPMDPALPLLGPPIGSRLFLLKVCICFLCNLLLWGGRTPKCILNAKERGKFLLLKVKSSSSYFIWRCSNFERDINLCEDSSLLVCTFLLVLLNRAQDGPSVIGDRSPWRKMFPSLYFSGQLVIGPNSHHRFPCHRCIVNLQQWINNCFFHFFTFFATSTCISFLCKNMK